MEKPELIVDGFEFPSYKEAKVALKEKESIDTISQRLDMENGSAVYQLYEKMIQREIFKTIIGYHFLYELRHQLVTKFMYTEEDLSVIPLPKQMEYDKVANVNKGVLELKIEALNVTKNRMKIAIFVLIAMIIAMFIIAAVNPNVGYINTENKILNKYSAWQEDLEERERAIKEKEAELGIEEPQ